MCRVKVWTRSKLLKPLTKEDCRINTTLLHGEDPSLLLTCSDSRTRPRRKRQSQSLHLAAAEIDAEFVFATRARRWWKRLHPPGQGPAGAKTTQTHTLIPTPALDVSNAFCADDRICVSRETQSGPALRSQ